MSLFRHFSAAPRSYRGSALLASAMGRMLRVLAAVAFLWGMTAWAMGWW